jgi:tRNA(Ile)-lysidine synthase
MKKHPPTPWGNAQARFHQTLRDRHLLPKQACILIAVSGGQDSLALAQLLFDLKHHWDWTLALAHCNHRWRPDADANAQHVANLAQQWNLPHWEAIAKTPLQGEAAARQWRYAELQTIAQTQGYGYLVTGHTASDRAETLLYNLIRGCGTDGLAALPWQRPLTDSIQLIRPLLDWTREETLGLCHDRHLPIWLDSTNQDPKYARNRLRLEILPALKTHFNPQADRHLAQTAELLSADVACLETLAQNYYEQALLEARRLDRQMIKPLPIALQRRVFRQFLQAHLPTRPNFSQIEKLLPLLIAPQGTRSDPFPGGSMAQVIGPAIELVEPKK